MRAMWKGAISFGLVSIAVRVHAATEERTIRFRQVHRDDGGRISIRRFCDDCDREVAYEDVAKGYEVDDGQLVVVSDEELTALRPPMLRTIEVGRFVRTDEIDPILYDRTYFLEPDDVAVLPYTLLRDALRDSRRTALARVALRQVERLAAIRVRGDMLMLHTMIWPDELRVPEFPFLSAPVAVPAPELARTTSLVDAMTERFDPGGQRDDYRAAVLELVAAKVGGDAAKPPGAADAPPAQPPPTAEVQPAQPAPSRRRRATKAA
ncbi:DNA end-binding protein Ku [Micromonospora phaseoli]|uniref:Non-homologous end joining protein Ku n=1 Tax=Micromonospora phaseoli TaxID=1144548 RepID=A0A1H7C0Z2_9ACTN|nr:Ku protein [Micromonospora phaseoli]PZV92760.1 DNA end-binding protein Ku [Micromonospora phaseoli]GIJ76584.1 non-homologous end joining protein Ku [Micromonospora phaseoli]SEJ82257.1 DNA end-binding protein Ku [Micromonospora phaseoli]